MSNGESKMPNGEKEKAEQTVRKVDGPGLEVSAAPGCPVAEPASPNQLSDEPPSQTAQPGDVDAEAGELELLHVLEVYEALGERPRHIDMRANDDAHDDAHTLERHGPEIPLERRLDVNGVPDGTRTIEGRIYGDEPWPSKQNFSSCWHNEEILNQVINLYIINNWEKIRSDLAVDGQHSNTFMAEGVVGESYYNGTYMQPGPPRAIGPVPTNLVYIAIKLAPGDPPTYYVVTTYPNPRGF